MEVKNVPDAARVASRLVCLDFLIYRASMEVVTLGGDENAIRDAQEDLEFAMIPWLNETGLWNELSGEEKALIPLQVGSWDQQAVINATWRIECTVVLQWALGKLEKLPCIDIQTAEFQGHEFEEPEKVLENPVLRSSLEISEARDLAEFWHWRSNVSNLMEQADEVKRQDYMNAVRNAVAVMSLRGIKSLDGDLAVSGKPFHSLDEADRAEIASRALERHTALNWLCGYGEDWDTVPVDT